MNMAHIGPSAVFGSLMIDFLTICGSKELTVYGRGVRDAKWLSFFYNF
jgi:hypothetical protein